MLYWDDHYDYENGILSIRQLPVSQATREKATKNRAARGRSEGDNDKAPSTSRFHFSKGNYGDIVLVWHGVLIQKAKANLPSICAQGCKALGVMDVEIRNDKQRVNPEARTCVGFDSKSESDKENIANNGDNEDHGNNKSKDDWNSDIGYHINDGNNDDMDNENGHNNGQNDAGLSRSAFEVIYSAEKNDGGNKTEEVDPGTSHLRGRCSTQSYGHKWSGMRNIYI